MPIKPIKALFRSIGLIALLATTANQQVQAFSNPSNADIVRLAAASLSGPVSMAQITHPDSELLGRAENILKAIDEFMAIVQYREFHPSLIGWFCYDVYHAFASLQGPAVNPAINAGIADQLAELEDKDTNSNNSITLSNEQRNNIREFIRYSLTTAEAITRIMAACENTQADSPIHANYLWDSRGFLHSLTSLARLANHYLETPKNNSKALVLVLIIINTIGAIQYYTSSKHTLAEYRTELTTNLSLGLRNLMASLNTMQQENHPAAIPVTTPAATTSTTQTIQHERSIATMTIPAAATPTLEPTAIPATAPATAAATVVASTTGPAFQVIQATQTPIPAIIAPATTAMATDARNMTILPLTASFQSSATASTVSTSRSMQAIDRARSSTTPNPIEVVDTKQATLLDLLRMRRPLNRYYNNIEGKFNHTDFQTALLAYLQSSPNQRPSDPYNPLGPLAGLDQFCIDAQIRPFYNGDGKYPELVIRHLETHPLTANPSSQELIQFCTSLKNFITQEEKNEELDQQETYENEKWSKENIANQEKTKRINDLLEAVKQRRPAEQIAHEFNHDDFATTCKALMIITPTRSFGSPDEFIYRFNNFCYHNNIQLFFADPDQHHNTTSYNAENYNKIWRRCWYEDNGEATNPLNPFAKGTHPNTHTALFFDFFKTLCTQSATSTHAQVTFLVQARILHQYNDTERNPFNFLAFESACNAFLLECNTNPRQSFARSSLFEIAFNRFCRDNKVPALSTNPITQDLVSTTLTRYWNDKDGMATNPFDEKVANGASVRAFCQGFERFYAPIKEKEAVILDLLKSARQNQPTTATNNEYAFITFKTVCRAAKALCEAYQLLGVSGKQSIESRAEFERTITGLYNIVGTRPLFLYSPDYATSPATQQLMPFYSTEKFATHWYRNNRKKNPFSKESDGTTTVGAFCDEFERFYTEGQQKTASASEKKS